MTRGRLGALIAVVRSVRGTTASPTTRLALKNVASLIGTFGVTAVLGMVYWLIAAQHYSRDLIGVAGGITAAIVLIGQVCTLGFGTMLMGVLPRRRSEVRPLVASAMALSGLAGVIGGVAFALVAPLLSSEFDALTGIWMAAIFALGAGFTAAGGVFDGATIGILRGGLQLWRNGVFAVAKLALLIVFVVVASSTLSVLVGAWSLGLAISLAFIFVLTHRLGVPARAYQPRLAHLSGLVGDAVGHQIYNLAYALPTFALPILVLGIASANENAGFYVALQTAGGLWVVTTALTNVLFAIGALEPQALAARIRLTFSIATLASLCGIAVAALAGSALLGLYGSSYRDDGTLLLIMVLASLPLTVKTHFIAVTRIQGRVAQRLPLVWSGACAEVAAGATGAAIGGAEGTALAWTLVLVAEAFVMAPIVWRAMTGAPPSAGPAASAAAGIASGGGS